MRAHGRTQRNRTVSQAPQNLAIIQVYPCGSCLSLRFPHVIHFCPPSPSSIAVPSAQCALSSHPEHVRILSNVASSIALPKATNFSSGHHHLSFSLQIRDMFCICMFLFPSDCRVFPGSCFYFFNPANTLDLWAWHGAGVRGWREVAG